MSTEVWARNPNNYIKEVLEVGLNRIVWDRGLLRKRAIDPKAHADIYFAGAPYRLLVCGQQGTADIRNDSSMDQPTAVYPTWEYGDDGSILEELMANPVGENENICEMKGVKIDELPVLGQEHRVVVINAPDAGSGPGRAFNSYLKGLQEDYPDCIVHYHGSYSFNVAFGLGFRAADMEARSKAAEGKVFLPMGKTIRYEVASDYMHWVGAMGMTPIMLKEPRNRCIFNLKSALWAGEHFMEENNSLRTTTPRGVAARLGDRNSGQAALPKGTPIEPGDMLKCDTCTLAKICKSYRPESICTIAKSETKSLSSYFQTRDADMVIDGLAAILAKQTQRTELALAQEESLGDLSPEVTRMMRGLMSDGIKYAKLVDPGRFTSKVSVSIETPGALPAGRSDARVLVSEFIKALEARGIPREAISERMLETFMEAPDDPNIIESVAIAITSA